MQGDLMMDLRLSPPHSNGVHAIHGDLVLKNGMHLTDDDFRLSIEALYFPDLGRVFGRLQSRRPIAIRISSSERLRNTPYYREALRREAKRWSQVPPPLIKYGVPTNEQFRLYHRCHFFTNLTVSRNESVSTPLFPDSAHPQQYIGRIHMTGGVYSPNCNISLSVSASSFHLEKHYSKAVHYTLITAIVTFIQILLMIKQMEGTSTPATSMRVSLFCISQQTVMDACLCLLHLTAGIMVEPLFNAFAMVAFFEFVLFAIFEMRYMLLIWRAQRGQTLEVWDTRRELSILYMRFYGVLLSGILIAFHFQRYMHYLMFFLYSFWIPQIIHCIREDVRQPLKPFFIIGMTISRLFLPFYLYGCPVNMLEIKLNFSLCLLLFVYVSVQVSVLLVQYYYGPHCFLPKRFLPHKHDYFRQLTDEEINEILLRNGDIESGDSGVTECVICMNQVEIRRPRTRMVTPCGHFFHPHCLQRWMDVKMECPTCRQMLPPL
eukprot:g1883.t1